jgi:hypothetical protein
MTPELETLDQLLGGDLPLRVVRDLYPDLDHFRRGVLGLLTCGDVRLLKTDETEVPSWRWRELFAGGGGAIELANMKLRITAEGTRRIT